MEISIKVVNDMFLTFDSTGINYIAGHNKEMHRKIYRALKRISTWKTLSLEEEEFFGCEDLSIHFDEKKMKKSSLDIYFIESQDDLLQFFSLAKGSILRKMIEKTLESIEFSRIHEQMNHHITMIEKHLNESFQLKETNMSLIMKEISQELILKSLVEVRYKSNDLTVPYDYIDKGILLNMFLDILEISLDENSTEQLLILSKLEENLGMMCQTTIIQRLKKLTSEHPI
ncbi:MAG: hypothetical protein LBV67_12060 [Streptococcaceae bacterium]|jgi:hypothetical protein|nr:hypothetical protein [Streptococcaceae bacterium]